MTFNEAQILMATTAIEELQTARDELLLLVSTLEGESGNTVRSILGRVERALDLVRGADVK